MTRKEIANCQQKLPKMISLEKWKFVGDLGKLIVAKGFKNLPIWSHWQQITNGWNAMMTYLIRHIVQALSYQVSKLVCILTHSRNSNLQTDKVNSMLFNKPNGFFCLEMLTLTISKSDWIPNLEIVPVLPDNAN